MVIIHTTFYASKSAGGGVLDALKGKDSSGSRCASRSLDCRKDGWKEVPICAPIFLYQHLMCVVLFSAWNVKNQKKNPL